MFDPSKSCWQHPKIRENWKMVLAAIVLLLIGIGMFSSIDFTGSHFGFLFSFP
jgi:hypothetical protein